MTKSTITRERIEQYANDPRMCNINDEIRELARMALAAMDSSESVELPLDYLQGHKDGLDWAAQLAESNHPQTGDWLYDDPIELAKAIRKGPDMTPAQPVADSEPVIVVGDDGGDALSYRRLIQSFEPGTKLYRHAQPVPVVPEEKSIPNTLSMYAVDAVAAIAEVKGWNACRAAMLQAYPVCTCPSGDGSLRWPCPVHPGNSPTQSDCCPAKNSVSPEQNGVSPEQGGNSPATSDNWQVEAEKLAEMHGMSFVMFRHGEAPQCADPTKVVISFTDKGLGHDTLPAATQEVKGE